MAFLHVIPGWFELASLAFCIGVLVHRLLVFPPSAGVGFSRAERHLGGMWRTFGAGVIVMILCTSSNLLVRAVEMSGVRLSAIVPVLPIVLFRTHFGSVWIARMTAEILSLLLLNVFCRRRDSRLFLVFLLGLMVVISATESLSGHASDKGDFSVAEIMDWLHLLPSAVWGGGLLVLSFFILPELVEKGEGAAPLTADIARRFSKIAGVAVGFIAATALYNAWTYVGGFGALWKTAYGMTVIAKIILFVLLINFGAFNRYINVPLLQQWGGFSSGNQGIMKRVADRFVLRFLRDQSGYKIVLRFKRSVRVEALLIIGVLLCAAVLRHEVPARHASHLGHQRGGTPSMPHHDEK
ncbi:MAG: CopD family protein [Nitrospirae bacterium]|nr:CopD family protein [Nitrospirota bacterium]